MNEIISMPSFQLFCSMGTREIQTQMDEVCSVQLEHNRKEKERVEKITKVEQ